MTFIDRIKASGKDFNTFKTAIQDKCYEGVYVNVDMKNGLPYIEISTHHRFRIYDFHVEMANVNDENYAGKYENICSRILSSIFEDYADKKAQYDQLRDQVKSIDKETYKKFWHKYEAMNDEKKNKCKEILENHIAPKLAKSLEVGIITIDETGINIPVSNGSMSNSGALSTAFETKAMKYIFRGSEPERFCKSAVHELLKKVLGNEYIENLQKYNSCINACKQMEGNAKQGELCEKENQK